MGYRGVQLSATDPETRPRDLSQSARRDLAHAVTRLELVCAGLDLFIPAHHFTDPAFMARAFDASVAAIELAAALGRVPVTLPLPPGDHRELHGAIGETASRHGVGVLVPILTATECDALQPPCAASVDCAAVLGAGGDPVALVLSADGRVGGVRVAELGRAGLRMPVLDPRESRLDLLTLRVALETVGFQHLPVVDARQWDEPDAGLLAVLDRWKALVPA